MQGVTICPVLVTTALIRFWSYAGWRVLALMVPMALAIALVSGLAVALWRALQGLAYKRLTES